MKIKYNIPKINELKLKIGSIKEKIKNNKGAKVKLKYYVLLVLMIMLGVGTLSLNMKKYNNVTKEEYKEYILPKTQETSESKVSIHEFETAISSISTNIQEDNCGADAEKSKNKYVMPVQGDIVKEYAMQNLVYSKTLDMWQTHPGIDIKADIGSKVRAIYKGKVTKIEKTNFYGNTIYISHSNGYMSVYANLEDNTIVTEGEMVTTNQTIGYVGVSASGEIQDESHLHLEILKDGGQINPLELLK